MKKLLSLLLALCLLSCGALAEAANAALPEVVVDLGEKAELTQEDVIEGQGYMRSWTVETTTVYLMVMNAQVTADEMIGGLSTSNLQSATLVRDEGGIRERRVYKSETDNMAVDTAVIGWGDYSIVLMLMSEKVTYEGANQVEMMGQWLESMTIDGAPAVTDLAAAMAATEAKLAVEAAETAQQIADGELVAIPKVGISFGGEGVLVNESGAENAYMQQYMVGDQIVFVMAYLGEYLCDGVWQSIAFELPENETLVEDENGIRQRKTYAFSGHVGDVTVIWRNGCTVALVVSATAEDYQAGLGDTITEWIGSMTIDGVSVITPAE